MTEKEKDYAAFSEGDPNMADKLKDYEGFVNAVLMRGIPPEQASALFPVLGADSADKKRQLSDEELKMKKEIVDSLLM